MMEEFWNKFINLLLPRSLFEESLSKMTAHRFIYKSGGINLNKQNGVIYLLSYKNKFVKKCIWLLKYKSNKDVARLCAEILSDYFIEFAGEKYSFGIDDKFVMVPIPISKEHLGKRRYNQCKLILKELQKISPDIFSYNYSDLKKIKNTKSQTETLNREERLNNIKNSFRAKKNHNFKDQRVILIDDVVTTGSTLVEARKTLEKAGAKEVILVAIAH